jgi:ATP synthase protein I
VALRARAPATGWGRALDLGIQFGFSVVVGLVLGYYADRWLGSEPIFLFVFTGFGFAAGMRALLRFARASAQSEARGEPPGSDESSDR